MSKWGLLSHFQITPLLPTLPSFRYYVSTYYLIFLSSSKYGNSLHNFVRPIQKECMTFRACILIVYSNVLSPFYVPRHFWQPNNSSFSHILQWPTLSFHAMGLSARGFRGIEPGEEPDLWSRCLFVRRAIIRDESWPKLQPCPAW